MISGERGLSNRVSQMLQQARDRVEIVANIHLLGTQLNKQTFTHRTPELSLKVVGVVMLSFRYDSVRVRGPLFWVQFAIASSKKKCTK